MTSGKCGSEGPAGTTCCIGGGVIGLEMACILLQGRKVTVVECCEDRGVTDPEICDVLISHIRTG